MNKMPNARYYRPLTIDYRLAIGIILLSAFSFQLSAQQAYAETCSSISQYGITWTFDQEYECGQFVNGDWWVVPNEPVGTITVVMVDPAPTGTGASARHGSMLNPMGRNSQSYDGRGHVYTDDNKVIYAVQLTPWDSLMSSMSRPEDDPPRLDVWGSRYWTVGDANLLTMAVLTCVPEPLADRRYFRPPYSYPFGGATTDKPLYDAENLQWDLLPSITPTNGSGSAATPSLETHTRAFQRVCPMHVSAHMSQRLRPVENTAPYYREQHQGESRAALLMLSDPALIGDRTELVRNFIQFGIDTHFALRSYNPQDPVRNDRVISKWPQVFASVMLGAPELRTIPVGAYLKTEECAYAAGWTGADVVWVKDLAQPSHETLHYAQWCQYQSGGSGFKADAYRRMTHSWTWVGTALAARLMTAQAAWNHDAFFDYIDRWMLFGEYANDDDAYDTLNALASTNPCADSPPLNGIGYRQGQVPAQAWVENMWDTYRPLYDDTTVLYGDVSGSGTISSSDAALVARYVVGLETFTEEQKIKADVSGNGTISSTDAALIAQRAVGLIDVFPVENQP